MFGLERHKPTPPVGFTAVELAARTKHLKEMHRDYPEIPWAWLELTYDWHHRTPKEEVERIMTSGEWEGNGKFKDEQGGTLHSVVIEEK